ncbi:hypothetical protein AOLI_G00154800 [Acnodon oligacanthus]
MLDSLRPPALTLRCYQCIPGLSGQCNDTQTDCSDQCAIMTTVTYVDLSRMKATGISGRVSCCEGNLCNSAEGVKLGLLNLLVPLISSMLFT